jgi:hypothetical protein
LTVRFVFGRYLQMLLESMAPYESLLTTSTAGVLERSLQVLIKRLQIAEIMTAKATT